jgi:hypothetical protein
MPTLEDVFGVSSRPVLSYVERSDVDDRFKQGLLTDKQIIVYGSSKQGKTALVSKHLPYEKNILVSLTPKATTLDIYQTILSKAGVRIVSGSTEKRNTESAAGVTATVKAFIPLFGGGDAGASGNTKAGSGNETNYEEVPINLEMPQHVCDLLEKVKCKKWVVLENFHYLNEDTQKQFAFDLRAYQELRIRFVILGVWREKNRMAQFNGDLLDRVIEVPVEPWTEADFRRVVERGSRELSIRIDPALVKKAIDASFSSIGVFQELLKGICNEAGVKKSHMVASVISIKDEAFLNRTIASKAHDYAARHHRALEAIAGGHKAGGGAKDSVPLFLPYYLVRVLLEGGFDGIANGMQGRDIHEHIKKLHHRGEDVRPGDMTNLLGGLANLQAVKGISPPIIDYDFQNRLLQVVDSTFYFFIKHANIKEILDSIPNPLAQT